MDYKFPLLILFGIQILNWKSLLKNTFTGSDIMLKYLHRVRQIAQNICFNKPYSIWQTLESPVPSNFLCQSYSAFRNLGPTTSNWSFPAGFIVQFWKIDFLAKNSTPKTSNITKFKIRTKSFERTEKIFIHKSK